MMKKKKLSFFLLKDFFIVIFVFYVFLCGYSEAQTRVSVKTYYPSPFGTYDKLYLEPQATLPDCNALNEGSFLFDNAVGQLAFCKGVPPWSSIGSVWDSRIETITMYDTLSRVYDRDVKFVYPTGTETNPNIFVGIGTTTPEFRLSIDDQGGAGDGSIIFKRSSIGLSHRYMTEEEYAVTGPGTRLIWYSPSNIFKAGGVSGDKWDLANFATDSVTIGYDTSTSIADQTGPATAIGENTTAAGRKSAAFGLDNSAYQQTLVLGINNQTDLSGLSSYLMRYAGSFVAGIDNFSSGAMALGYGTRAESGKTMGFQTQSTNGGSLAAGGETLARESNAIAMGYQTIAGPSTPSDSGVRMNYIAMGVGTRTADTKHYAQRAVALGTYNVFESPDPSNPDSSRVLFSIGNGTDDGNRSNAFTLLTNGYVGAGVDYPVVSLDVNGFIRLKENDPNSSACGGLRYNSGENYWQFCDSGGGSSNWLTLGQNLICQTPGAEIRDGNSVAVACNAPYVMTGGNCRVIENNYVFTPVVGGPSGNGWQCETQQSVPRMRVDVTCCLIK